MRAPAEGYTLLYATSANAVNAALCDKLHFMRGHRTGRRRGYRLKAALLAKPVAPRIARAASSIFGRRKPLRCPRPTQQTRPAVGKLIQ